MLWRSVSFLLLVALSSLIFVSPSAGVERRVWIAYSGGNPAVSLGVQESGWPALEARVRSQAQWYADNFGWKVGLWLHNPFGHGWGVMKFDQRTRLTRMNGSGKFDAVLDMQAMQKSLGALQRDGIPVGIYLGGPEQMPLLDGESVGNWIQRLLTEIEPIRRINPPVWLAFDSTAGEPPQGSGVDRHRAFITAFRAAHRGPLLVEPGFVNDWMGPMGIGLVANEPFFLSNIIPGRLHWYARQNPKLKLDWHWRTPREVRGPVMVIRRAPASAKPYDFILKQDDPAKVADVVAWVNQTLRDGYCPIVKAPHLPGYLESYRGQ